MRVLWEGDSGEAAAAAASPSDEGGEGSEDDAGGEATASHGRKRRRKSALTTAEGCWYTARVTGFDPAAGTYTLRYIVDQEVRGGRGWGTR